jgi:hypothetical protein
MATKRTDATTANLRKPLYLFFPTDRLSIALDRFRLISLFPAGPLSVDPQREKKLPPGKVPQLEARLERGPDDVRHVQNGQDGEVHERLGDVGTAGGVSLSRSGPQGYQQRLPDQDRVAIGHTVLDQYHGTPPFRSVRHDSQYRQQ